MNTQLDDCLILDDINPAIYQYLDGNISKGYGSNPEKIVNILKRMNMDNPVCIEKRRQIKILKKYSTTNRVYYFPKRS